MDSKMREYEVHARVMVWLLEHGKIAEVAKIGDKPLAVPKLDWIDPEEFRRMAEQRYPNEQRPKKQ